MVTKTSAAGPLTQAEIPAHIEKMAAAIQELSAKGVDTRFTLELPLGNMNIQSAVLGRDASGQIAIQLQADGLMPPAMLSRLSAELAQRLRFVVLQARQGVLEHDGASRRGL